jgi:hypothetical protein
MIIFFCHKCNKKVECETKAQMKCDCGHYIKKHDNVRNHVNMRTTWSGTTKIEFSNTTIEEDINRRNNG